MKLTFVRRKNMIFYVPNHAQLIRNTVDMQLKFFNYSWGHEARFTLILARQYSLPEDGSLPDYLKDSHGNYSLTMPAGTVCQFLVNIKYQQERCFKLFITKKNNPNSDWEYFKGKYKAKCVQIYLDIDGDSFNSGMFEPV